MARPENADSARTFERIMRSARTIVRARGADELSFRRVAAEASVSVGTVRYYFSTTEELIEALLDPWYRALEDLEESMAQVVAEVSEEGAPAAIGRAVRAAYQLTFARREEVALRSANPSSRRMLYLQSFLDRATPVLVSLTGRSEAEVRLIYQSITFAIVRWATATDEERCLVTGADPEAAHELIEQHLVDLALRSLF